MSVFSYCTPPPQESNRSLGNSFLGNFIEGEQKTSDCCVSAVAMSLSKILNLCQLRLQETEYITLYCCANHYNNSEKKESSNSTCCRPLTLCCITLTVPLFIKIQLWLKFIRKSEEWKQFEWTHFYCSRTFKWI